MITPEIIKKCVDTYFKINLPLNIADEFLIFFDSTEQYDDVDNFIMNTINDDYLMTEIINDISIMELYTDDLIKDKLPALRYVDGTLLEKINQSNRQIAHIKNEENFTIYELTLLINNVNNDIKIESIKTKISA